MLSLFSNLVGKLERTLELKAERFAAIFQRTKPQLNTPIIFSCRSGKRAQAAAKKAMELGYKK